MRRAARQNAHRWNWLALAILSSILWPSSWTVADDGFHRVSGENIDLVTDLVLDADILELPALFDAAMPQWCRIFHVDPAEAKQWRATAYLMAARERFATAGYLPAALPPFPNGYQWGNDVWVVEQASVYYRRHLLLHEGTHWFMVRKFGSAGPPWLMEGMAEYLATHRWHDGQLELGIVPRSHEEALQWNRISLIQQQLDDGLAPSMATILRYDSRAHQSVDAYAWSWAIVMFLKHHSSTSGAFEQLFESSLRDDATSTAQLLRSIQSRRSWIRAEWSAMLTGLDYGFQPHRDLAVLDRHPEPLASEASIRISAQRGWQATGIQVEQGQRVRIAAEGRYVVGTAPRAWHSEADGVTLRYYRGQPLGKLLLAIAGPEREEPEFSETLPIFAIGSTAQWTVPAAGQILLRINESVAGLDDNSGELSVKFSPER